jgi:hypothetical protein
MSLILLICFLSGFTTSLNAQVKITEGAIYTMDVNFLLEMESTNKGLLIPRIAINDLNLAAPMTEPLPAGMMVYSSGGAVPDAFYYRNGYVWALLGTGAECQWITNSTSIYYNTDNAGIGTTNPVELLDINGDMKIRNSSSDTIRATNELVLRQDGDVIFDSGNTGISKKNIYAKSMRFTEILLYRIHLRYLYGIIKRVSKWKNTNSSMKKQPNSLALI